MTLHHHICCEPPPYMLWTSTETLNLDIDSIEVAQTLQEHCFGIVNHIQMRMGPKLPPPERIIFLSKPKTVLGNYLSWYQSIHWDMMSEFSRSIYQLFLRSIIGNQASMRHQEQKQLNGLWHNWNQPSLSLSLVFGTIQQFQACVIFRY